LLTPVPALARLLGASRLGRPALAPGLERRPGLDRRRGPPRRRLRVHLRLDRIIRNTPLRPRRSFPYCAGSRDTDSGGHSNMNKMMLVLAILVAMAVPAQAQWGYPVQHVYDSGYTYILYSSGNIVREGGWGGRVLIDNGTGSSMIAAGNGRCYVLKNN